MPNLNIYLADKHLVARTRKYARQRRISVSKLIEQYLTALTQKTENSFEEIIKELSGSLPPGSEFQGRTDYIKKRAK